MCDLSNMETVKEFYGQTVQHVDDFKVKMCRLNKSGRTKEIVEAEKLVHPKVKDKYYGCGVISPDDLEGLAVLDLGCGAGMDCFVLSKLVGLAGFVTGVDCTEEQLKFAEEFKEYHREKFGHKTSNIKFVKGNIEDLKAADIRDKSQDIVISNCVISLVVNKKAVFREAYRVLKDGGEFFFSDMYSNKPVPDELKGDKEMWGEGLTHAQTWDELLESAREIGFCTPLLVETTSLDIADKRMKTETDKHGLQYISATYRMFKCCQDGPDPHTDYVQVTYNGGIQGQQEMYKLSCDFSFQRGIPCNVPKEIASILCKSRLGKYFTVNKETVKEFYGQTVQHVDDFKVKVCTLNKCGRNKDIVEAEKLVHQKVKDKYYGCGVIAPDDLEGLCVLDLGCGAGMDCFVLSRVVGQAGFVTGIDVTDEQLEFAEEFKEYHRDIFGHKICNTKFVKGSVEDLKAAGIGDESQDLVISNCVISLVANKKAVFREAYRVLKDGGEFYFSDMYVNKPVPDDLKGDKQMWGEGLTHALTWHDLLETSGEIGFCTPLLVETTGLAIEDRRMKTETDKHGLQYISATYRLFKCLKASLDPNSDYICVTYNGGIQGQEEVYNLSCDFSFKKGVPYTVPNELSSILCKSRLAKYFTVIKKSIGVNPFTQTDNA